MNLKPDTPINLNRTVFSFTCYGDAHSQSTKLLLRSGQVNRPVGEVCNPVIRVAFNQDEDLFLLENNTMVEGSFKGSLLSES